MSAINISRQILRNITIFLGCCFLLCSCVATPPQTHFLAIQPDQKLPVTVQVPINWELTVNPKLPKLILQRSLTKEHVSITAKKLGVEQVDLKLLKVFGRINIKDWLNNGWEQQRYQDDVVFDGIQATKYVLRKHGNATIVYHVGKNQYAYIVSITAPAAIIAATDDTLRQSVHLGKQGTVTAKTATSTRQDTYTPHANILNLNIPGYNLAEENYLEDVSKALRVNERVILLEQICLKYILLKSESFFFKNDKTLNRIYKDIEQLAVENNNNHGLARCKALVVYLNNNFPEAVTQLEELIERNPDDIQAKLYLSTIRPYQTSFIKKTLKEIAVYQKNNLFPIYIQSKLYLAEGKDRESKDLLKATLQKHPQNLWITFAVARIHQVDGDLKNAVSLYKKVVEMDSTFAPAIYNLALINYKNKKTDAALRYVNTLPSMHLEDPETLLLRGLLHKKRNKNRAAKSDFEAVLTVDPDNYRALYNLGALCATKLRDTNCARLAFSRYISIAPTNNRHASIINWLKKN